MLDILAITAGVLLIVGLLWVIQPYRNWKNNFDSRQYEPITITAIPCIKHTLVEYLSLNHPTPVLSLVVPSYNEESRLPVMLHETAKHLKKMKISNQIIIVNDGSKDKTTQVALAVGAELQLNLIVVEYPKNRGKGGAVRAGMTVASGEYVLMADADGATTFSDVDLLFVEIKRIIKEKQHPLAMVVGSRRLDQGIKDSLKVQRKWYRAFISAVFKFLIGGLLGIDNSDTQCGFKLFTQEAARKLFRTLHIERFAFDVELFFLCKRFGVSTMDVGVEWRDVDGSKLNVLDASVNMFRDVLMIRVYYWLGLWRDTDRVDVK